MIDDGCESRKVGRSAIMSRGNYIIRRNFTVSNPCESCGWFFLGVEDEWVGSKWSRLINNRFAGRCNSKCRSNIVLLR